MQMDQYFHHYLGWRLAEGGLPYLASFDQNFPGGAILHALCILLFGNSSFGFAVFDLILQSIGLFLIAACAKHVAGDYAALLAPVIYALTYIGLGIWDIGQRDAFIVPFLAGAVHILLKDDLRSKKLLQLGLLCGFMILLRPVFILFAFNAALAVWMKRREMKQAFLLLVYGALPSLVVIGVYTAIGEFGTLYESTVQFNLEVYGKFRHGVSLRGSGSITFVFAIGLLGLLFAGRERLKQLVPVFAASLIAPISTFVQGQGDAHHMTPSYAMSSIWVAVGLISLIQRFDWLREGKRFAIAVSVVLGLVILRGADRLPWESLGAYANGNSLRIIYERSKSTDVHLKDELAVADYLKPRLSSQDHIYIWSMRIWPYQLTGVSSPTRFQTHEHYLMQPKGQPLTELQMKWRREVMRDLEQHPPKYILWSTTDHLWLLPNAETSKEQLKRFPEFAAFVQSRYLPDTTIGAFEIVRLQ